MGNLSILCRDDSLHDITLHSRICFFAGENGTGKSTLLEAIAAHYGFGREGGNRNFSNDTTASNHSVDPLVRALRLSFDKRTGAGYFLRAESFFNSASYIDDVGMNVSYGGKSLHAHSHGEMFFTVLDLKFRRNGLFLLDEPEAALSPQRQLAFLVLIHDVLEKHQRRAIHYFEPFSYSARISQGSDSVVRRRRHS